MNKNYLGFAVIAFLSFVACRNIFSKDKRVYNRQSKTVVKTKPALASRSTTVRETATIPDAKDTSLRYVYLTFDDGPEAGTMNCYDICKTKGVKATFFLIGAHANRLQGKHILDTMRKDMRHFLFANHSYTHASYNSYEKFYSHPQTALSDFIRLEDSLKFQAPIVRFPGNNVWVVQDKSRTTRLTRPLSKLMDSAGYNVVGWDVEWHFDSKSRPVQSAEAMAAEVVNAAQSDKPVVKNHVVVLAHDRMFREPGYRDSLAKMITILQSHKGFIFETADQYPAIKKTDRKLLASRK